MSGQIEVHTNGGMKMVNPNNNKNFNDEALRINRELKRENDELRDALVTVIRSLDEHHYAEVQSTGNSLGIIRQVVDQALNYPRYRDV